MTRPRSELENWCLAPCTTHQLHAQDSCVSCLVSPQQTLAGRSSGAGSWVSPGSSPLSLSSWEVPSGPQPLLPASCILAGGSREKGTPQCGHRCAAAVVSSQGGGLHGATSTSPLASHGLNACVSPAPRSAGTNLKSIRNLGAEIGEWKEEMHLRKRPWLAQGEDKHRGRSHYVQHGDTPNAGKVYLKGRHEMSDPWMALTCIHPTWDSLGQRWHTDTASCVLWAAAVRLYSCAENVLALYETGKLLIIIIYLCIYLRLCFGFPLLSTHACCSVWNSHLE